MRPTAVICWPAGSWRRPSAGVAPVFDRSVPRVIGLPGAIRSDNGVPFSSTGAGGLSRLSVQWLKLGIRLERIEPGCPQQNGRHERMHRTLKAETAKPPAATLAAQQGKRLAPVRERAVRPAAAALGDGQRRCPRTVTVSLPSRRSLPFTEATASSEKEPAAWPRRGSATGRASARGGAAFLRLGTGPLRGGVVGRAVDDAGFDGEHVVERRIARAAVAACRANRRRGRRRPGATEHGPARMRRGRSSRQQVVFIVFRTAARCRPA